MKKYKLVLFDLDGVIVDSKRNMEVSWAAVQAAFQMAIPFEKYFEQIGIPFNDIMTRLGLSEAASKIKMVYDAASLCRMDLINSYYNCTEIMNTIKKKGLRTGIVTSKDESRTLDVVKKLNLLVDVIECPNGVCRGKPSPDPLLRAILQCQMDPVEAVYIGDMKVDEGSAKRAGIDYIHAEWGYGNYVPETTRRANVPEDILKFIFE